VNLIFPHTNSPKEKTQSRLFGIAAIFLFLNCVVLMFAPAVRLHAWVAEYNWKQWIGFAAWLICFSLLYRESNRLLPDHDPYLLPSIALLSGWGLLEIFRLDPGLGFRQTVWLVACLLLMTLAVRLRHLLANLKKYKYLWLVGGLVLTLLTFFFGTYPGGSGPRLWLGCCGVYLQPSEILKILLIIYLAAYLADSISYRFNLVRLLTPTLILIGAALLLLVAQKDLGTASLFIIIYTLIVYIATGKRRVLLASFLTVVIAFIVGYLVFDVIRLRIEAWINPWLDPSGRSYQIVQSILTVANGGLFGRGLGLGSPGTVPVAQSDFIFSAITEEFGLAGAIAIVILISVLTVRGFSIALHAANNFQRFLAVGIVAYLASQTLLILGGTVRLLPLTGVTFPFVSYGGSSLLTSFFSALLLLIISNQAEDQPATIQSSRAYILVGSVYLVGFTLIALAVGWWSIIRSGDLLTRTDNPRRVISDRYVLRGEILDRNNNILAQSEGTRGDYARNLLYPGLSATVGYSNPDYGQTGIEASMDDYLRGITGNSSTAYLLSKDLYGQYPLGLDIRLSLDLDLQTKADALLEGKTGAIIVMNASSGEILTLATSPTFDANQLDTRWPTWMAEDSAPLLNRVTQGQYPAGSATAAFILARYLATADIPQYTPMLAWSTGTGSETSCAFDPGENPDWQQLVADGCVGALLRLTQSMTPDEVLALYEKLGLTEQPEIEIESAAPIEITDISDNSQVFLSDSIRVSPLQMAIAAAELTNGGIQIKPTLVMAYKDPAEKWTLIPNKTANATIPNFATAKATTLLQQGENLVWSVVSQVEDQKKTVSWYVAGTPNDWQGIPLVFVVALEDSSASSVQGIGQSLVDDLLLK
jgi:cell division protein FtsW (lipid II flippase)